MRAGGGGAATGVATSRGGAAGAGGGPAVGRPAAGDDPVPSRTVRVPLTHVKIFGWYDNEMGSYTQRLGELTATVAQRM